MTQIRDNFVPPILFTSPSNHSDAGAASSSISHVVVWRFVACRVLPNVTRTAATRFSRRVAGRTHLPCSRLHARLADIITDAAGRRLPYPFTPHRRAGGSALCCGCSHCVIADTAPPLAVSWGNRSGQVASSGWESGSSSADVCQQRRLRCPNLIVKLPRCFWQPPKAQSLFLSSYAAIVKLMKYRAKKQIDTDYASMLLLFSSTSINQSKPSASTAVACRFLVTSNHLVDCAGMYRYSSGGETC